MTTGGLLRASRALTAGAVCLAILGGMIVSHAWPLWTGTAVVLRGTPVDPRDLFRGEFVRLDVAAGTLRVADGMAADGEVTTTGRWWGSWAEAEASGRGAVIFVQLVPGEDGLWVPVTVSRERVPGAVNLKGRIRAAPEARQIRVDYGLDAYYMEEGAARPVEDALRAGRDVRLDVAVAGSGRARIRTLLVDGQPVR